MPRSPSPRASASTPTTPIQLTDFSALLPLSALQDSVETTIDRALEQRPDLIARSRRCAPPRPRSAGPAAAYWPTLSLVGDVGTILGSARITADGKSTGWFKQRSSPATASGWRSSGRSSTAGARRRRVELAEIGRVASPRTRSPRRATRAVTEVWKAYTDVKLAFRRLDVAAALMEASQQSVR